MQKIKWLIITCDKTRYILDAYMHQWEKYLGDHNMFEIKIIDLKSEPIEIWTQNIYSKIKDIEDEFVVFSLDDYLIIDKFNRNTFKHGFDLMMKNSHIGRYELGYGASEQQKLNQPIKNLQNLSFYDYKQSAPYRVSCQISLWRTDYLFKFLRERWSPWEFETKGSRMAANDKWDIIGTCDNFALRCIEESALSGRHPGRVNVMGLKFEDLYELCNEGYIDKKSIQFGMTKGVKYDNKFDIFQVGKKYLEFYI